MEFDSFPEIGFKGLPGSAYKLKYSFLSCQLLDFVCSVLLNYIFMYLSASKTNIVAKHYLMTNPEHLKKTYLRMWPPGVEFFFTDGELLLTKLMALPLCSPRKWSNHLHVSQTWDSSFNLKRNWFSVCSGGALAAGSWLLPLLPGPHLHMYTSGPGHSNEGP